MENEKGDGIVSGWGQLISRRAIQHDRMGLIGNIPHYRPRRSEDNYLIGRGGCQQQ